MSAPWSTKQMLKASSTIIGLVGISYILTIFSPLAWMSEFLFDLVIWPLDGAQTFDTTFKKLLIGTLGAVIVLLAYTIHSLVSLMHDEKPQMVEGIILRGIIGWYLVEAVMSLIIGVPANLLLNVGFCALYVVPILWGRRRS